MQIKLRIKFSGFNRTQPKKPMINIYLWHSWFAWYPVRICDSIVFFERVQRKREVDNFYISHWIYKLIPNKGEQNVMD